MELDVTVLINAFISGDVDPMNFSASIAETGQKDIHEITWHNACHTLTRGHELYFDIAINRRAVISHFLEYGAWDRDELQSMPDREIVGLVLQEIAGDYRELSEHLDWDQEESSGRIYSDESQSNWYYYIGV